MRASSSLQLSCILSILLSNPLFLCKKVTTTMTTRRVSKEKEKAMIQVRHILLCDSSAGLTVELSVVGIG